MAQPAQGEEALVFEVAGKPLRITHPSKVLFPQDGITKAELLQYYLQIAPALLPHIRGRPLIIKAFPHGIQGRPYHRRWLTPQAPAWLPRVDLEEGAAPVVEDAADLLWVVNQDSVELHPWLARRGDLLHPDLALFDLDPGPQVPFRRICEAALVVKEALDRLGVQSWPKTSGANGLHVLVGIQPRYGFEEVHTWVIAVARVLCEHRRDLFTMDYTRSRRVDKVLVDHNQVGYGRSTASIYSVRPLPQGPVSAPLTWREVASGDITPGQFTLRNMPARLAALGDVAAGLVESRQPLPDL
ncbi:MAG: DNA polymerase domain-containing protein [Chloroflexi bacterium]|nr:DNA polymerase domain-containing protein [Chloroflexota bacterium]